MKRIASFVLAAAAITLSALHQPSLPNLKMQ
jgi:hypothetical protein